MNKIIWFDIHGIHFFKMMPRGFPKKLVKFRFFENFEIYFRKKKWKADFSCLVRQHLKLSMFIRQINTWWKILNEMILFHEDFSTFMKNRFIWKYIIFFFGSVEVWISPKNYVVKISAPSYFIEKPNFIKKFQGFLRL